MGGVTSTKRTVEPSLPRYLGIYGVPTGRPEQSNTEGWPAGGTLRQRVEVCAGFYSLLSISSSTGKFSSNNNMGHGY